MRRRWLWVIPLIVLCILSAAAAAVLGIKLRDEKMAKGELEAMNHALQSELDRLRKTSVEEIMAENEEKMLGNGEIYYSRENLKEKAREAMSLTELMSMLFSDRAVYYDGKKYIYAPILDSVKKHDYDIDCIVTDEETGIKTYTDASGRTALKGIDVSEWQGYIDWSKVKADGIQFAFIRAGLRGYESGTIYEDTRVRENLEGATANGIPIGMYFYTQAANTREAVEEAEMVLELISGYDVTWPIVLDAELENASTSRTKDLTTQQRTENAIAFCERIEQAGYKAMIYGNMRMLCGEMNVEGIEQYDKWFAQYFYRPWYPYEYGIWQYSCEGKVSGISGDVDLNLAFRDYGSEEG